MKRFARSKGRAQCPAFSFYRHSQMAQKRKEYICVYHMCLPHVFTTCVYHICRILVSDTYIRYLYWILVSDTCIRYLYRIHVRRYCLFHVSRRKPQIQFQNDWRTNYTFSLKYHAIQVILAPLFSTYLSGQLVNLFRRSPSIPASGVYILMAQYFLDYVYRCAFGKQTSS